MEDNNLSYFIEFSRNMDYNDLQLPIGRVTLMSKMSITSKKFSVDVFCGNSCYPSLNNYCFEIVITRRLGGR